MVVFTGRSIFFITQILILFRIGIFPLHSISHLKTMAKSCKSRVRIVVENWVPLRSQTDQYLLNIIPVVYSLPLWSILSEPKFKTLANAVMNLIIKF